MPPATRPARDPDPVVWVFSPNGHTENGGAKGIRTPDLLHAIYGHLIERASVLPFWPEILRSPQSAEIRRGAVRLLYSTAVWRCPGYAAERRPRLCTKPFGCVFESE